MMLLSDPKYSHYYWTELITIEKKMREEESVLSLTSNLFKGITELQPHHGGK